MSTAWLMRTAWCLRCRYAKGSTNDKCAVETREQDRNGKDIGPLAESVWLRVVPWSFYKLLKYVQNR